MNNFGEKLKKIRQIRGLSVTALAEATGIARRTIYDWEAGKRVPASFASREIIAAVCQVDIGYFFDKKNEFIDSVAFNKIVKQLDELEKRVEKLEKINSK